MLHSFWLQNARLKQDLLPGRTITQWFAITKAGKYPIACAELCGNAHTTMKATLVAEPDADYRAWVAERSKTAPLGKRSEEPTWKFWRENP